MDWPMPEKVAVAALRQKVHDARVGTNLPGDVETLPGGFVRVTSAGGEEDGVTLGALIDIEGFHRDRMEAWKLAERARQVLLATAGTTAGGVLVDRVTTTGVTWVFYGEHVHRYVGTARVWLRREFTNSSTVGG